MRFSVRERGFSLVEMVAAIVVMSIMAVGLVQFIVDSSRGYVLSASRNQVSSAARVVIDRIAMELRNALPESVRISTAKVSTVQDQYYAGDQCLEFIPVTVATTYLNPTFRPSAATSDPFEVVNFEPMPVSPSGHYAVIYPTSPADLYKDTFTNTEVIVEVTVGDVNGADGKNEVDPLTSHRFMRQSGVDRLFLTSQPVSYCITGAKLYRYENYGFHTTQLEPVYDDGLSTCPSAQCLPSATAQGRKLIVDNLNNTGLQAFDYLDASRRRNAVIQLDMNFSLDGQEVRLTHEIMQQSTP